MDCFASLAMASSNAGFVQLYRMTGTAGTVALPPEDDIEGLDACTAGKARAGPKGPN